MSCVETPFVATKDPDDDLDYGIDWSAWLGTDTISSSAWSTDSVSISLHTQSVSGAIAITWVAGGPTSGVSTIRVTNEITTAGARVKDRTIIFTIRER